MMMIVIARRVVGFLLYLPSQIILLVREIIYHLIIHLIIYHLIISHLLFIADGEFELFVSENEKYNTDNISSNITLKVRS